MTFFFQGPPEGGIPTPVTHWPLDEYYTDSPSSVTAHDVIGGLTGSLQDGASFSAANDGLLYCIGESGGSRQKCVYGGVAMFGSCTIMMQAAIYTDVAETGLFYDQYGTGDKATLLIFVDGSEKVSIGWLDIISGIDGTRKTVTSTSAMSADGALHTVAGRLNFETGEAAIILDGVVTSQAGVAVGGITPELIAIITGNIIDYSTVRRKIGVKNLRVFDSALTNQQIADIFAGDA